MKNEDLRTLDEDALVEKIVALRDDADSKSLLSFAVSSLLEKADRIKIRHKAILEYFYTTVLETENIGRAIIKTNNFIDDGSVLNEKIKSDLFGTPRQIPKIRPRVAPDKMTASTQRAPKKITPPEMVAFLDRHIVGQDRAKKIISIAICNHYKRLSGNLRKSNVLLIGPTGSGKTFLMETASSMLNVPFVAVDATSITNTGYKGKNVDSIIRDLLNISGSVGEAKRGIVFIDEIDKYASRGGADSQYNHYNVGKQQDFLKMMEGTTIHGVDTSNILFVFGGAFIGIDDAVKSRTKKNPGIGFYQRDTGGGPRRQEITHADLVSYGFIPEFVGRIPIIATTDEITKDMMVKIATATETSIVNEYKLLFAMDGIELKIEDQAIEEIVDRTMAMGIGARGLRTSFEFVLADLMYEIPRGTRKYVVTADFVRRHYESEIDSSC